MIILFSCKSKKIKQEITVSDNWTTFSNDEFSISYPNNWIFSETTLMGMTFFIKSPRSSKEDNFLENINLFSENLKGLSFSLNKYIEISEKSLMNVITNLKVIENKRIKTKFEEYQKIIYTNKQGIYNLTTEQYTWVVNNKSYILTFVSKKKEYHLYKSIAEKIMDSFKIK